MHRYLLDRWTDTTVFRGLLFFSGCLVLPVLGIGVLTTVVGGAVVVMEGSPVDVEQVVFALLSIGGAVGFVGYLRAHRAARAPSRHDITATLVCLAVGIGTALAVAVFVAAQGVETWLTPWGRNAWLGPVAAFAAANAVWAFAGAAWMQRLTRVHAEHELVGGKQVGRAFDSLPLVLLLVAIALTTAALLVTVTL
jgi:hypothetical protein